jgi:hypothetical protein
LSITKIGLHFAKILSALGPFPRCSIPEAALPGLLIYRFTHSMYYANAQQMSDEILDLVR